MSRLEAFFADSLTTTGIFHGTNVTNENIMNSQVQKSGSPAAL